MSALIGLLLRLLAYISPQYSELGDEMDSLPEHASKIEAPSHNDILGFYDEDASDPARKGA